jgi:hypothetical protein
MQKDWVLPLCLIGVLLLNHQPSPGQGLYTWKNTGLVMQLPYDTASAEIMEEGDELRISWPDLELHFMAVEKDSAEHYFANPYHDLLMELIREFRLIRLTEPQNFTSTPEGVWLNAKDTAVFTDTAVLGALSWPGADLVVIAVFDCYGSPLNTAIAIMQSLAFKQYARPKND